MENYNYLIYMYFFISTLMSIGSVKMYKKIAYCKGYQIIVAFIYYFIFWPLLLYNRYKL